MTSLKPRSEHAGDFDVRDFGAIGDGAENDTDDTDAIKNAIAAAKADGGGVVLFPRGVYKITDTLLIQGDNIILRGVGGRVDAQVLHGVDANKLIAAAPSRILWGGANNGTMVKFDVGTVMVDVGGIPAEQWVNHSGCGLQYVVLDGAGVAATCFQSLFENCLATNYGQPFCGNDRGLILWGDALRGNINYSNFFSCGFLSNPGLPGLYMNVSIEQADNCNFFGCWWNYNLYLHADDTGTLSTGSPYPSCAVVHTFYGCGGPIIAMASLHGGSSSNANVAYGYRMGNGVSYPLIEPGADLTVHTTAPSIPGGPFTTGGGSISYGEALAGVVVNGSVQSVANDTLETVVWPATFYDSLGASSGGRIIVPQGVKWARATAQVCWDVNLTGWRYAEIGTSGGPQCRQWCPISVWDGAMMLSSQWFPVFTGEIIGLNVKQNSGGPLKLAGPSLQVEFK